MSQQYLLCTDLDRTLLPNGKQKESGNARHYFERVSAFPDVTLAYVSGRDSILVKQAVEQYMIPAPDFAVCDVGTTIYCVGEGGWDMLEDWHHSIASDWNGYPHSAMASLFADIDVLQLQEWENQNTFKLSYYVAISHDRVSLLEDMETRLYDAGVKANLIWSIDEEKETALLDVIPASATKKHAINFLQSLKGIPDTKTLFAGDSGNDLPVLISSIPSVLVANATEEVKQEATLLSRSLSTGDALYIATGGYQGMNGNYSAGILEGLSYYYPDLAERLEEFLNISDENKV
ncbi:MAG: HAD-IIB family hydrolase [Gammaproteobacteria bacterium]